MVKSSSTASQVCASLLGSLLPVVLLATSTPAAAQAYPSKPVKIMVGASPGGGTDIIARMLAEKMAGELKQPFVVENRPGASNTIAADVTAKAPADGHTLLVATNTGQAIAPHLIKLGFDPNKDLTPVALIVTVPNVLVINPQVGARDVKELVAMMKSKPTGFSYASSGVGSTQHLAGEAFKLATGTQMSHVPYKGSAPAIQDVIGGQVPMMFDTSVVAGPFIESGKVRALAVTSAKRTSQLPNVPTMAESGVAGYDLQSWQAIFAPAGVPAPILSRLQTEVAKILKSPEIVERLGKLGMEASTMTPEQFAAFQAAEIAKWAKVIKAGNIKID